MRNYIVSVSYFPVDAVAEAVTVATIQQATGLATQNLIKNRRVTITPTTKDITHSNTAAAQAFIDVALVYEEPVSYPVRERPALRLVSCN
jgi:hypothetical protein